MIEAIVCQSNRQELGSGFSSAQEIHHFYQCCPNWTASSSKESSLQTDHNGSIINANNQFGAGEIAAGLNKQQDHH